jgi:serine/threonine-protein kinase
MGSISPHQAGDLVAGKYRLEREIGAGGMGVVFAAIHVHLDQRVALKFLFEEASQSPELVERFWREARAAVKIQSEHVARVIDVGQVDGSSTPYIVMEYLEGDNLENIVKREGPLEVADAVRYILQTCEALAEVHAQGMVHRDVKPANLFLAHRSDGTRIVKLLDFGISKAAPVWADERLTNTAAVIGSPRYMSPEQLRSAHDVDARTDIWALGVSLFELLGGKGPFARGTMPEICASILKDEPLSLQTLRPTISKELEAVIRRCLQKPPEQRYRTVAELALALRPFGPRGIIDISIERIVGITKQGSQPLPVIAAEPPKRSSKPSSSPTVHETRTARSKTDEEMEKYYLDRIGPRRQVPRIAMDPREVTRLALDHRTGFLLSLVDGRITIEELTDVSGMPRVETLRIVCELLDHGVLALTPRPR